jgi:plastocyanin
VIPKAVWLAATLLSIASPGHWSASEATIRGTVYALNVPVAGAVVYLVPESDTSYPPPLAHPVIDQAALRFVPRVLVILPGTTVDFRNSDPILHNIRSLNSGCTLFCAMCTPKWWRTSSWSRRPTMRW